MYSDTRIIFSDNGTLIDYSHELNNFTEHDVTLPVVAAEDALYIGSRLPFNHFYFDIKTQNNQAGSVLIQNWWSNSWNDVFDIFDGTKFNGNTFSRDGIISWTPDEWKGWDAWARNDLSTFPLKDLNIFGLYWIKITFTVNLHASTAINFIGHKFSEDNLLYNLYPDLNNANLKTAFKAGKVTWDEQHFQAAREIIDYLKVSNMITTKDQVLDFLLFEKASIHKTAELIYFGLGKSYNEHMLAARDRFKEAMNIKSFNVDKSSDGVLNDCEIANTTGEFYR